MVPYDVLVDPLSLPDHPLIAEKHNAHDIIHEDSARNSDDDSVSTVDNLVLVSRRKQTQCP